MANTFKLKRSSVQNRVPTTSDLDLGELAWNSYDGKLYGKKDDGTAAVVEIGASSGGIASVVADTTPQLGGDFDLNSNDITGTGNIDITGTIGVTSADAGSAHAPYIDLYRNSASPAPDDLLGKIRFYGENDANEKTEYAYISSRISDETDGTEDGKLEFYVLQNGNLSKRLEFAGNGSTKFVGRDVHFNTNVEITFEGTAANPNETKITVVNPTQDNTITIPDSTGTVLLNVVEDTTPQLGGNLDLNSNDITGTGGIDITGTISVTSTDAGNSANPSIDLYRNSESPATNDTIGSIRFYGENDADEKILYGQINGRINDETDGTEDGRIDFYVAENGTQWSGRLVLTGNSSTKFVNKNVLLGQSVNLVFEGASDNTNETTLTVVDPTQDNTITLPDATGTVLLNVVEDTTPQLGGNLDLNSNDITGTGGIDITGNLTVRSTDAGSGVGPEITLYRNSASPAVDDWLGRIRFYGEDSNSGSLQYASIYAQINDETSGTQDGELFFAVRSNGVSSTRLQFNGAGSTCFYHKNVYLADGVNLRFEGATDNSFETELTVVDPTQDNTITLPDSTGTVVINSSGSVTIEGDGSSNQGKCILNCENNSHNVTLQAPAHANFSSSWSMTLPGSAGTNGQLLTTNGSGVCSWTTVSGGSAGGASAITMNDSVNINFGTGADFEMHCDGSGSMHMDMNSSGADNLLIRDGTTTRFTFARATGNLTATGNVTAYSDINLKKEIKPIKNALDKVCKINGVTFQRADLETQSRFAGVIAQEVEQVLPEVVSTDEQGFKSVAYGNLVGLLVEAIKEQQAEIDELKAHVYDQGK
tara:strand:+ start:9624 stop:12086 length:2463 start_codon:yes stop_codon:yes gene_type:complete